jgi:hypothetical protein
MPTNSTLPGDLKRQINAVIRFQRQHPQSECFTQSYIDGVGWRLISVKTGKEYTPDSFKEEFGYYPDLPHPEVFYSDQAIAARKAARERHKRPKPKGFAITVPIKKPTW